MLEKVSVIIPTYNREKTILRAIQSVLDQTYTNIEVLVIDDGSTDGTADIVNSIADERVRYVVLEQNGGQSRARNIGVEMAEGEWIAFQDSDDCWHKNKLEKQIEYAENNPRYTLIYCMCMNYFQNGESKVVPPEPRPKIMEGNMLHTLLERNVVDTPTIFVNKGCFLNAGGFDTTYKALEDWEFMIRFSQKNEIGYISEILMDSYMLSDGVSSNISAYFESRCKMVATYKEEMISAGVFESIMRSILERAQGVGILDTVKKMMMFYLSQ